MKALKFLATAIALTPLLPAIGLLWLGYLIATPSTDETTDTCVPRRRARIADRYHLSRDVIPGRRAFKTEGAVFSAKFSKSFVTDRIATPSAT